MKTCSKCNQLLPLTAFAIQSTGKQGHRADCKNCVKRFIRSKEGLIKAIYVSQKRRSNLRGYKAPTYTEQELLNWVLQQTQFHTLYNVWVNSGYLSDNKPSIDRINDYKGYCLSNIQLTTWKENNLKGKVDKVKGINNKNNIAIDMLDLENNFIERFYSISEAARRFNGVPSNIIGAITGRTSTRVNPDGSTRICKSHKAYGHKWRYSIIPNENKEQ
jgi:hypothetical protein